MIYQTKLASWLHDTDENRNLHQQDTSASAHYIKLHAPWSLLCRLAEELNLRAPLQVMLVHPSYASQLYPYVITSPDVSNPAGQLVSKLPLLPLHSKPDDQRGETTNIFSDDETYIMIL